MNRSEIVSLLNKNIDELILVTRGFAEMEKYPVAILDLARKKTDEIRHYIEQLSFSPETESENIEKEVVLIDPNPVIPVVPEPEISPEPVITDSDNQIEEVQIEKITETIQSEEIIPVLIEQDEKNKTLTLGEKLSINNISMNDLHARPTADGVHSTIKNNKITDIKQAISLGDRFRFQRELFRNNGEEMNKMLNYINMLATFDEAFAFLISKYGWTEDNPVAADFFQIVKRRF